MEFIQKYYDTKDYNMAFFLSTVLKKKLSNNSNFNDLYSKIESRVSSDILPDKKITVLLLCNWCSSKELCDIWNKMSKGNYSWNNIKIVWEEPCDYYCVINQPPSNIRIDTEKTIFFKMEPHMNKNSHLWNKDWMNIPSNDFKFFGDHDVHFNNNEWHLSKTYTELKTLEIVKEEKLSTILSTILSDKYSDPGHIKRVDFVKFLETKNDIQVDVFGGNRFMWNNYKGSLPYHQKDQSILPYKYSFNVENFEIKNYYTEKLIDGILGETLVFYHGCPNIKDLIDERAYVWLELSNFEKDYETIKKAIKEDLWSQRINFIREAKQKILDELQFFPRIEKIINL
jgi:hypothetical protein